MYRKIIFLLMFIGLTACAPDSEQLHSLPDTSIDMSITETPFQPAIISVTPTQIPVPVYLTGAGDISVCDYDTDDATAALLENAPGLIFTLGDTQYNGATNEIYANCFDKSWGQYKDRMIPVIGNHEYEDKNATGFYDYFDYELDPQRQGYYSMDAGA